MTMPFEDRAEARLRGELKEIAEKRDAGYYRNKTRAHRDDSQPYGELYIDVDGDAGFICHTNSEDFAAGEVAIRKWMALFQKQLDGKEKCPFNPDKKAGK